MSIYNFLFRNQEDDYAWYPKKWLYHPPESANSPAAYIDPVWKYDLGQEQGWTLPYFGYGQVDQYSYTLF